MVIHKDLYNNKAYNNMLKKSFILLLFGILLISSISAAQDSLGTFKLDKDINLYQVCDDCTAVTISSLNAPDSTTILSEVTMSTTDNKYYNYTAPGEIINQSGVYTLNGYDDTGAVFAVDLTVTSTGRVTPDGIPFLLAGIFIIVFGISCFFLVLSSGAVEVGPKIFFFIASLVFLIGSIGIATVVATDSNVSAEINNTMYAIIGSLGLIIFVIIAYIMVKQFVSILEIMNVKKGYSLGPSSQYAYQGYNTRQGI